MTEHALFWEALQCLSGTQRAGRKQAPGRAMGWRASVWPGWKGVVRTGTPPHRQGPDVLSGKASMRPKLLRRAQVHYHGSNTEAGVHTVRLPKESTAADVCETLRRQLPEDGRPARLRLLEVFYSKIYKARKITSYAPLARSAWPGRSASGPLADSRAGACIMSSCTLVLVCVALTEA